MLVIAPLSFHSVSFGFNFRKKGCAIKAVIHHLQIFVRFSLSFSDTAVKVFICLGYGLECLQTSVSGPLLLLSALTSMTAGSLNSSLNVSSGRKTGGLKTRSLEWSGKLPHKRWICYTSFGSGRI